MNTNMESKYYTPDISEFVIGFEYERNRITSRTHVCSEVCDKCHRTDCKYEDVKEWVPEIFERFSFLYGPYTDNIRVKYLDEDDIRSLGFIQTGRMNDFEWEFQKQLPCKNDEDCWNNTLEISTSFDNEITIERDDHGTVCTLFHGIIKNKSELVRLLKQLNIK